MNRERATKVWSRIGDDTAEAQREAILDETFGRERQEEPQRRRIIFEEPPPPPRVDRPLGIEAFRFIASAAAHVPVPVAFNPSDGACHGGVDELRWRLEAEALGVYNVAPTEVSQWVQRRTDRLVIISAEMLQADSRRLERLRWSPGHPVQYLSDDELEPLPELPVLTCPGCGGEDIAVHDRDVPPDADCRRCNRHFTVRRQQDTYGRTVFEVPAPPTTAARFTPWSAARCVTSGTSAEIPRSVAKPGNLRVEGLPRHSIAVKAARHRPGLPGMPGSPTRYSIWAQGNRPIRTTLSDPRATPRPANGRSTGRRRPRDAEAHRNGRSGCGRRSVQGRGRCGGRPGDVEPARSAPGDG